MSAQPAYNPSAISSPSPTIRKAPATVRVAHPADWEVEVMSEPSPESIEEKFHRLAHEWIRETAYLSDPIRQILHPAHLKIIAMGPAILPLVLAEVQKRRAHWFVVLDAISPENPVRPEDERNFEATTTGWLEWGKKNNLI